MNKYFFFFGIPFLLVSCDLSGVNTEDELADNDTGLTVIKDTFTVENHDWVQPDSVNGQANEMVWQRDDGLRVEWTEKQTTNKVELNDVILVNLEARVATGDVYDSNAKLGHPVPMKTNIGMMVPGFQQGLLEMHVGDLGRIMIPSPLGYGENGYRDKVPDNADLIIEIEVVDKIEPIVLEEGVKVYKYESVDTGSYAVKNQKITFHYFAYTKGKDGHLYDNSYQNGEPFSFKFENDNVIDGLHQGLGQLKAGEAAFIEIPASLAYGSAGIIGLVPANTDIVYDVRVESIE